MIREWTHKVVSFLLVVGIVFSTTGITFSIHTCKYTGDKKAFIFSSGDCCLSQAALQKESCCMTSTEYAQLDMDKVMTDDLEIPLGSSDLFTGYASGELPEFPDVRDFLRAFDSRPPPLLTGTERINFLQQYLL